MVRSELERTKSESANLLKEEKRSNRNEIDKVRQELERALKGCQNLRLMMNC